MTKKTFLTVLILLVLFLMCFASSCSYKISGIVTHKSGDTVKVKGYTFLVPENDLKLGQAASFTQTSNWRKANSKIIKNKIVNHKN